MKDFSKLKKNLKKDFSKLKKINLAVLGDSATQFLVQVLRGLGFDHRLNLNIWESGFNQIQHQIFDSSSDLYKFNPEVVIIFQSSHKLLNKYNKLQLKQQVQLATEEIHLLKKLVGGIVEHTKAKIIYYNYTEIDDSVFGNFSNKVESSFLFQLRKLNYLLMEFAAAEQGFYICDISSIQNMLGKPSVFKPSIYINAEMLLNVDVLPIVASKTIDIINSFQGKIKKCVILDLDNTLWGGIIGDDGIENIQIGNLGIGKAFTEFQYWIKKLKNRGVILAICSKNTESIAKEPFEKHPDMVLKLEDIAVFIANWENKADNIRQIQKVLNIGFDSMVFLDDNPFERNIVRENISDICVPELPEDPADYLEYLYSLNLFDTISFSSVDTNRNKLYQIEAQRTSSQQKFTNENDFLKSLNMLSIVEPFNNFNTPRVAELTQRSNQFNLRTIRYTDSDIKRITGSNDHYTFAFSLVDKFGDNGIIGVIILKDIDRQTLFIDTWIMSCRVLKRGVENFVLNTIAISAKENGANYLKGEYIPTSKNEIVKNFYSNLGFNKQNNQEWILCLDNYNLTHTHVKNKQLQDGKK